MSVQQQTTFNFATGNGLTTLFVYQFLVLLETDLQVFVDGVLKTLGADYSVAGVGASSGGSVTFSVAPVNGARVQISRAMRLERLTDYQDAGDFLADTVNPDFDRSVMLIQDVVANFNRTLRSPADELDILMTLPAKAARAGKYLAMDANGQPIASSGTGNDTALRTDLANQVAGSDGANLIGFKRGEAGAVARTLRQKLLEIPTLADFGADPTGVADSSPAFATWLALSATLALVITGGTYKINTAVSLPDGAKVYGVGRPLLKSTVNGQHILDANNRSGVFIEGIRFQGNGSATAPLSSVGGFASTSTGLVTITNGSDSVVRDCEFKDFYNGLSIIKCSRVVGERNRVGQWLVYGILASLCSDADFCWNKIIGCDQNGAAGAYGFSATGDQAGGTIQKSVRFNFNEVRDVPSWDGVMTHDCDGFEVCFNDIRNVRNGVDIGHINGTNVVKKVKVLGNTIEATTTNTWGGAGAIHNAILVIGFSTAVRVEDADIQHNKCIGFYNMSGATISGNTAHIVASFVDGLTINNNKIRGGGVLPLSPAGIFIPGDCSVVTINGNSIQGAFGAGAIRLANAVIDTLSIDANSIRQTTVTDAAITITGSTVAAFSYGDNPTNSTAPFTTGTSTLTYSDALLRGSAVFDPANLVDGAGATTTVTVSGCVLGDFVLSVSFSLDTQGILLYAWISAANTVSVRFQNETGGALDLGSGTLRALVRRM